MRQKQYITELEDSADNIEVYEPEEKAAPKKASVTSPKSNMQRKESLREKGVVIKTASETSMGAKPAVVEVDGTITKVGLVEKQEGGCCVIF